ncbi:MAG: hypothetical protein F6K47_28510 [Symploca sp. SIO2E6]|nr:hypothetical protein [Symploca sp. SIO2E6]
MVIENWELVIENWALGIGNWELGISVLIIKCVASLRLPRVLLTLLSRYIGLNC